MNIDFIRNFPFHERNVWNKVLNFLTEKDAARICTLKQFKFSISINIWTKIPSDIYENSKHIEVSSITKKNLYVNNVFPISVMFKSLDYLKFKIEFSFKIICFTLNIKALVFIYDFFVWFNFLLFVLLQR